MHTATERPVNREEAVRERALLPAANILEMSDEYLIELEVPGVKREDVTVQVEEDELHVAAKRARTGGTPNLLLRERVEGTFHRAFRLGEAVDRDRITARCVDGVLTIHAPKSVRALPKRVTIG